MAFVDELTIYLKAGRGGDGVVRWRREKGRPAGGNGGRGGHVYARGVRNAHLLSRYRAKKEFAAARGEDGKGDSLHGADGHDLHIDFPIGSILTNQTTGKKITINQEGETVLILEGGRGGRGNETFKSSINRRPREQTDGQPGEEASFSVEVELIADVGLIGLPNAGKTSLLNA
ncbi:MAG: GTPase ObgE, partial [Patescibacteria group bacterium]